MSTADSWTLKKKKFREVDNSSSEEMVNIWWWIHASCCKLLSYENQTPFALPVLEQRNTVAGQKCKSHFALILWIIGGTQSKIAPTIDVQTISESGP